MDNFHSETIILFINLGNIKVVCDDHSQPSLINARWVVDIKLNTNTLSQ